MGPLNAGRLMRTAGQRAAAAQRAAQRAGTAARAFSAAAPAAPGAGDNVVRSTRHVPVPNDVTLTHFVLSGIVGRGAREALVDSATGQALTYGELEGRIATVAAGLAARGVRRGDVVAVVLPNTPFYPVLFHAIAALGGVVSSANPSYTAGELAHQLRDSASKLVVTAGAMLPTVTEAAGAAGLPASAILTLGSPEAAFLTGPPDASARLPPVPRGFVASRELVAMPYSSGTTGLPKGVELTHGNLIANVLQTMADPVVNCGMVPERGDSGVHTSLGVLPFFHIYGATLSLHSGLYVGTRLVCMAKFVRGSGGSSSRKREAAPAGGGG
jgi:acyl-CoA synthetase (AMP-forming)/AMP-acid ligase II